MTTYRDTPRPAPTGEITLKDPTTRRIALGGIALLVAIGCVGGPKALDHLNGREFSGVADEPVQVTEGMTLTDVARKFDDANNIASTQEVARHLEEMDANKEELKDEDGTVIEPGQQIYLPESVNP